MRKEILISDLSICEPKSALADRYIAGKWKRLAYEAENFKGVMLYAMGKLPPAPIKLPLRLRGWHEIYVAFYRSMDMNPIALRLRLSSDRAHRKFVVEGFDLKKLGAFVDDWFWKAADLTGEAIHIEACKLLEKIAVDHSIAYIRLVPLSAARVRALKRERARADTRRLLGKVDGNDVIHFGASTQEDIAADVDVYKESDWRGLTWEMINGDDPLFPVPGIKPFIAPRDTVFPHPGYEKYRRTREGWTREGFDYLRVVRDLTRSAGLELYVGHRMGHFSQPPFEECFPHAFLKGDYRDYCRLADGTPVARYSYAKRHVQDRMLRIYSAAAKYGIDGVHLMSVRGGPFVMYEDEMVARFRERHGARLDPRQLPLDDNRLWRMRADIFGEYLRRVRQTLSDSAREAGCKPPLIGLYGLATREACRTFGLDFKSWAQQGLVDRIIASVWPGEEFTKRKVHWRYLDMNHYLDCVRGTKTELVAELWQAKAAQEYGQYYRAWADKYYKLGVKRLTFWDTNAWHADAPHWSVLSVLGHKTDLRRRVEEANRHFRPVLVKRMSGFELAKHRFPPWTCG
ncbi:MAG: hypothetical protein HY360_24930 [Verrucomicrobia bacterium]|nr:hypothetical protein [Verrucomicrobiota bacterium]